MRSRCTRRSRSISVWPSLGPAFSPGARLTTYDHLLVVRHLLPPIYRGRGNSDFNDLVGFTSKKLPNNILNNVCLNWLSHFFRICILRNSKKYSIYTQWSPKNVTNFLHLSIKNTQNRTVILKSVETTWKCTFKKLLPKAWANQY